MDIAKRNIHILTTELTLPIDDSIKSEEKIGTEQKQVPFRHCRELPYEAIIKKNTDATISPRNIKINRNN